MRLQFTHIINKHRNVPAICIGHSPSLDIYKSELIKRKELGHILIDCNEWMQFNNPEPNYWVVANNIITVNNWFTEINKHNCTFVYADSVDLTPQPLVERLLECNYVSFDQRHFNNKSCDCCQTYGCQQSVLPNRLTIQEELKKYCGVVYHYSTGHSIIVHMLALAVLLGCNPIHYVGVDLSYSKGYAQNSTNLIQTVNLSDLDNSKNIILQDIDIIAKSAENVGVEIVNLFPGGI